MAAVTQERLGGLRAWQRCVDTLKRCAAGRVTKVLIKAEPDHHLSVLCTLCGAPPGSEGNKPLRVTLVLDCAGCQPSCVGAVLLVGTAGPGLG